MPPLLTSLASARWGRWGGVVCALLAALTLTACNPANPRKNVQDEVAEIKTGPKEVFRNVTNFTHAMSCMDRLLIPTVNPNPGKRVEFILEALRNESEAKKAGARNMMISALQEMTRRSRAFDVNAFGATEISSTFFQGTARKQGAIIYTIDGSISQFDKNVAKNQSDLGIDLIISKAIGLGGSVSVSADASVLAMDLFVLDPVDEKTVKAIPGVYSKNAIVIYKTGVAGEGEAKYNKLGVFFSSSLSSGEGDAQGVRNLVELGAVELMGRLFKVPYWQCLGIDNDNEEVRREIEDWFYALASDQGELVEFAKKRLRHFGFYKGTIDRQSDAAYQSALEQFNMAQGIPKGPEITLATFEKLLGGGSTQSVRTAIAATTILPPPPVAVSENTASLGYEADMDIEVIPTSGKHLRPGATFTIRVTPKNPGFLYCFYQDTHGDLFRVFPNRVASSASVRANTPVYLPGALPFEMYMDRQGLKETLACFLTEKNVSSALPALRTFPDFQPMPGEKIETLASQIDAASGSRMIEKRYQIGGR